MNLHSIVIVCWSTSVALAVLATWWSFTRVRFDQTGLTLEFLTRQAKRQSRVANIALGIASLCAIVALALNFLEKPQGLLPALPSLGVTIMVMSQLAQTYIRRTRALEEIIRHSLPEVYSKIAAGANHPVA
jgi:peptidoglycan/LPS O-acetylase OafA/YrhL